MLELVIQARKNYLTNTPVVINSEKKLTHTTSAAITRVATISLSKSAVIETTSPSPDECYEEKIKEEAIPQRLKRQQKSLSTNFAHPPLRFNKEIAEKLHTAHSPTSPRRENHNSANTNIATNNNTYTNSNTNTNTNNHNNGYNYSPNTYSQLRSSGDHPHANDVNHHHRQDVCIYIRGFAY